MQGTDPDIDLLVRKFGDQLFDIGIGIVIWVKNRRLDDPGGIDRLIDGHGRPVDGQEGDIYSLQVGQFRNVFRIACHIDPFVTDFQQIAVVTSFGMLWTIGIIGRYGLNPNAIDGFRIPIFHHFPFLKFLLGFLIEQDDRIGLLNLGDRVRVQMITMRVGDQDKIRVRLLTIVRISANGINLNDVAVVVHAERTVTDERDRQGFTSHVECENVLM